MVSRTFCLRTCARKHLRECCRGEAFFDPPVYSPNVDELVVDFNDRGMDSINPATAHFEADGAFRLRLRTHDRPARVHLRLDDALAAIASLPDRHYLVTPDEPTVVPVHVPDGQVGRGRITIETSYGTESTTVGVEVDPEFGDDPNPPPMSDQPPESDSSSGVSLSFDPGILAILALAIPALLAVGLVLQAFGRQPVVIVGSGVVITTILLGVGYLFAVPRGR